MPFPNIVNVAKLWAAENREAAAQSDITLGCKFLPDGSKGSIEIHAGASLGLIEMWSGGTVDFSLMIKPEGGITAEYFSFESEGELTTIFDMCFDRIRGFQE